jgi:hypothetical protein
MIQLVVVCWLCYIVVFRVVVDLVALTRWKIGSQQCDEQVVLGTNCAILYRSDSSLNACGRYGGQSCNSSGVMDGRLYDGLAV